jgi:hypothetical protein
MIAKRNVIIALMISVCLAIALVVSVCLLLNDSAAKNKVNIQLSLPQLKVAIAHFNQGYTSSIKHLLESKGIQVEAIPVSSLNRSITESYDLIIITGSERSLGRADYVKEYNKPVLGYGVYGCAYFGKLKLKNGQPYT